VGRAATLYTDNAVEYPVKEDLPGLGFSWEEAEAAALTNRSGIGPMHSRGLGLSQGLGFESLAVHCIHRVCTVPRVRRHILFTFRTDVATAAAAARLSTWTQVSKRRCSNQSPPSSVHQSRDRWMFSANYLVWKLELRIITINLVVNY